MKFVVLTFSTLEAVNRFYFLPSESVPVKVSVGCGELGFEICTQRKPGSRFVKDAEYSHSIPFDLRGEH